jgi:hypothetical protein
VIDDSTTITVNVMGTFSEKNRPNNGMERVARYLIENRLSHVPIVAEVGFHKYSETLDGHVLTIKLLATEPGLEPDGSDPKGAGARIRELLDELRKKEGKGAFEETLFSMPRDGFDFDGAGGEGGSTNEMEGQQELRLGSDGPHAVPEASAEELMAERAEAAAAADDAAAEPDPAPATAPARKRTRAATTDPFTPDGGSDG